MERTLLSYIDNPMGTGAAVLTSREAIKRDLETRFYKLEGKGSMVPIVYKDIKGNYFFHVIVPSETDRNNTYDVIIKFEPTDGKKGETTSSLKGYNVKFFSNSPAFIYTYAYVYNQHKLIVDELKNKISHEVLTVAPKKRNPQETFGYEKSLFFAAFSIMKDDKFLNKIIVDPIAQNYTIKKLENAIRNDEKIKQQIRREQNRIDRETKKEVADIKRQTAIETKKIKDDFKRRSGKISASKTSLSIQQPIERKKKIKGKGKIRGRR